MSGILKGLGVCATFMIGISVGMYYGFSMLGNSHDIEKTENKTQKIIQDVVIRDVQNDFKNDEVEEVSMAVQRVSPYAKMTIKKKFSKCGHVTVSIIDVPKELINLTEEEIEEKYEGWKVEKFSPQEFTIFRIINANCDDHFVLKENDGVVTVYNELTDDISNFIKKTDIFVDELRKEDKEKLVNGIKVYGGDELSSLLEDFNS